MAVATASDRRLSGYWTHPSWLILRMRRSGAGVGDWARPWKAPAGPWRASVLQQQLPLSRVAVVQQPPRSALIDAVLADDAVGPGRRHPAQQQLPGAQGAHHGGRHRLRHSLDSHGHYLQTDDIKNYRAIWPNGGLDILL